jgi:hypothetical protein
VTTPVSLRNLPATVLELAGGPSAARFPGRSLAGLWRGTSPETEPFDTVASSVRRVAGQPEWFPASRGDLIGVVQDSLRYLRILGEGGEAAFAFLRDPGERTNLVRDPAYAAGVEGLRRTAAALVGEAAFGGRGGGGGTGRRD